MHLIHFRSDRKRLPFLRKWEALLCCKYDRINANGAKKL